MPRLRHRVPKYAHHKATNQARIRVNGKTVWLGVFGSAESKARYAEVVARIAEGASPNTRTPTPTPTTTRDPLMVGECIARYYAHARGYYVKPTGEPTGEHVSIGWALKPLAARFDTLPVQDFGPLRLQQVRDDLIKAGWTRYSINKAVGLIRRCFTWCASQELCRPEIAMGLKTVTALKEGRSGAREKPPVGPVDDARIEATIPLLTPTMADALRLMRATGCRPGEVCAMKASEINRDDPACWWYRPTSHKCSHKHKDRVIPLGARAQEIVRPRMVKAGPGGRLFPITTAALCRAVHRACEKGGIAFWHPNMIRHTVGTEARARHGIEAARCLLGHSTADMTLTYAERDMAQAGEYAKKFG